MLRPSQTAAVAAVKDSPKLLLADMGSGKTAVALSAILARPQARTLLISTVRICRDVWPAEVARWTPELTYQNAAGLPPAERVRVVGGMADIVGVNFENLPWLIDTFKKDLPLWRPQLVVDESSKLENPGGVWFKALLPLLPRFTWRLPMTGTPRANHLQDLWAHAYLADLGATFGKYREQFRRKYFKPAWSPQGEVWKPKAGVEEEIYAKLKQCAHRLIYDGKKTEIDEIDVKIEIAPEHKARKEKTRMRQVQVSSGAIYDENLATHLHDAKLNVLKDMVSEAHGEPIVIAYSFVHEVERIQAALPQARTLDKDAVEDWNNGEIPVLLLHPLSAGFGLNIQHGGSTIIWFSPPPTTDAEVYAQTNARLARSGQAAESVRVFRLIAEGDAEIYATIAKKLEAQSKV